MALSFAEMIDMGDQILAPGDVAIEQAQTSLRGKVVQLTMWDRVQTGMILKMFSTFEALVDDARVGRGEAMHHLKTLCESYIYLCDAAADEARGNLVAACAMDGRRRYLNANQASLSTPNLPTSYDVVYRLACEPAHISDLEDFMPTNEGVFPRLRARIGPALRSGMESGSCSVLCRS
jgi:hypothetical protein